MILFADSDVVMIVGTVASCITSVVAAITAVYIAKIKSGQVVVEKKMDTAAVLVAKVAEKQDEDRVLVAKVATKQDQAVLEVQDVKTALITTAAANEVHEQRREAKIDAIAETGQRNEATGEKIHVLVNSNMGAILEKFAVVARELANIKKTKIAEDAASLAEAELKEHVQKQAVVDAGTVSK